ncbi:DUF397 domain-containing protein [Streptomyces sp. NPDC037389]|uniref:DUF397 domain-containing protein n=1 Tax=Streptomyces sp. NPDC037389 TaxID=3155369 RepID=UPI0033EF2364
MSRAARSICVQAGWFKSSYSNGTGGECLEAAFTADGTTSVRDSKEACGPVLAFSCTAWGGFVTGIRDGKLR